MFETIKQELDNLNEQKKLLADKLKEKFAPEVQALLKQYPEIGGIRWDQYAPYFNDGEPCVFGVHGINVLRAGDNAEEGGDEDDGEWQEVYGEYGKYSSGERFTREAWDALLELNRVISENEELMQDVFGDDCRVTITAAGIDVDSCDHD